MNPDLATSVIPASVFLLTGAMTPGPNNIVISSSVVRHGYALTIPYIMGVVVGFPMLLSCIGLGVHQVFSAFPELRGTFEIVSLCMLAWLSYKVATAEVEIGEKRAKPPGFLFSLMFQWINPKAWTVCVSMLTLYSDPDQGFLSAHMFALIASAVIVSVISANAWAGFGAALSYMLKKPRHVRAYNRAMGALLLLSSIGLFAL